ncbi:hypothetical protein K3Q15_004001 [Escherichia coli]|uniref:hypothetical protein n=1 Tax=Escherichia coli TaxID=562 RepID=UPI00022436DC|nr:hypothetical protein [Escherichia coli]EFG1570029.1 hypothetical protein [Escherichia coli]EFL5822073.1 hypothetical protein [Escherichia coli]EGM7792918.1 hypothetical protein [Escherichia coli]EGX03461.1 hypothetical protein ECSTECMHI813_2853 [Escherichia coli STEC_MHI813]EHX1939438.1 hypothetical protein [Escherichia coli]
MSNFNCVAGLIFIFSAILDCAFAADINTNVVTVKSIKADWSQDSDNNRYYYMFDGLTNIGSDCGYSEWARSGDNNINKILHEAYFLGYGVKMGIRREACTITTVVIDKTY